MAQPKRIDSKKIEKAAILAVKNLIQPCDTLDDKLNDDDKNILVDGSIELFRSPEFTIANFIGKIDVQVKGTIRKLPVNKHGFVKYRVEVENLRRYLEAFHGILFFCVTVGTSGNHAVEKAVYYAQLLPYDITRILTDVKPEQKTMSVRFKPFPTKPEEIIRLISAFNSEREKQLKARVSAYGFLDKNFEPPPSIKAFSFTLPLSSEEPVAALSNLCEGPYIYGEDQDGHFTVCGKMEDPSAFAMGVKVKIRCGDFALKTTIFSGHSKDGEFLEFEGVRIYLSTDSIRIVYKVSGGVHARYNTVRFMHEFVRTGTLAVNGKQLLTADLSDVDDTQCMQLSESLELYGLILETMEALHIHADWDISVMSEKELNDIRFMKRLLVDRKPLTGQKLESPLVHFSIQGGYIFALAHEQEDGSYEFKDLFSKDLFFVFGEPDPRTGEPKDTSNPVPPIAALDTESYRKIINLTPEEVKKGFERFPVTSNNWDPLNQKLLDMLTAYDAGSNQPQELLASAAILARRLYEANNASEMSFLNLMQTIRRKRNLGSAERKRLQDIAIDGSSMFVKAAAYALLDDIDMAQNCLGRCTDEERREIEDYPISFFFGKDCSTLHP